MFLAKKKLYGEFRSYQDLDPWINVPDGAVVNSLYGSQFVERNVVVYSIICNGEHW